MNFYLSLFMGIVFAFICAYVAKKKARSTSVWFVAGLFFSLFALILLLILPSLDNKLEQDPTLMPNLKEIQELERTEPAKEIPPDNPSNKLWYYLNDQNQQFGPMSMQGLMNELENGKIKSDTFVWNDELTDWKPLKETSDFQLFQGRKN